MFETIMMANRGFNGGKWLYVSSPHANLVVNSNPIKAENLAPFRRAATNPFDLNKDVSGGISHLLSGRAPAAVLWGIISIVVYPIQRMLGRWTLTHVGEKGLKTVSPTVAYADTSRPVSIVPRIVRVIAAKLHFRPSLVFWSACPAVCTGVGVAAQNLLGFFLGKAAAAKRRAANICGRRNGLTTAVALAAPHGIVGSRNLDALDSYETAVSLVLNVTHVYSPMSKDFIEHWGLELKRKML